MAQVTEGFCPRCGVNGADSRGYANSLCWECSVEYVLDNPGPEECAELLVVMREIAGDCSFRAHYNDWEPCENPAFPEDPSALCALHRDEICGTGCECDSLKRAMDFISKIVNPELFWPSHGGPVRPADSMPMESTAGKLLAVADECQNIVEWYSNSDPDAMDAEDVAGWRDVMNLAKLAAKMAAKLSLLPKHPDYIRAHK